MNNPRITSLLAAVAHFKDAFETIDDLLQQVSEDAAAVSIDIRSAAKHITDPVTLDRLRHEERIAIDDEMSISGARELWWDIANKLNDLLPSISHRIEEAGTAPWTYEEAKADEAEELELQARRAFRQREEEAKQDILRRTNGVEIAPPAGCRDFVDALSKGLTLDDLRAQLTKKSAEGEADPFVRLREFDFVPTPADDIPFSFSHFEKIRPAVASGGVFGKQL
ncbi:hypothetical protein G6L68_25460 [Agrobacterium fabrum]|uniref:hypothetical protein n=1 Tax=Agrobacterium fabrum TaxID=1176649 RepID=UPI000EF5CD6C|nr:hypothetical protein [Agrobacterium fabrum]AYM66135.1 hypothetical protein At12D13_49830 [Agrobacterium fabrum]NTE63983.1 hypothetical protein [Agrobacterium fabrum]